MSSYYLIGVGMLAKADNTVRENKNNCGMKMMTMLVGKHRLKVGGYLYGRVGHTHGCLGSSSKLDGTV